MRISQAVLYAAVIASQAIAGPVGGPYAPHISTKEGNVADNASKAVVPKSASPVLSKARLPDNGTIASEDKNNDTTASEDKKEVVKEKPFPFHLERMGVLRALPANASAAALKFQPLVDFDDECCYNTPAVDIDGHLSAGHRHNRCRQKDMIKTKYNNVYVRRRCNHGWCAWMYEYYFVNHRRIFGVKGWFHKWDNVVVWTKSPFHFKDARSEKLEDWEPMYVSTSALIRPYEISEAKYYQWNGTHPKVLYEKFLECYQFDRVAHDAKHEIINKAEKWVQGSLVEFGGFPPGVREALFPHQRRWSKNNMRMADEARFEKSLQRAMPPEVWGVFHLDHDEYPDIPESM